MGLFRLLLSDFGKAESEYADQRHQEFRERMEKQNVRLHAKAIAYENYLYHSNTPEEKAINRAIWLNL